MKKSLIVLSFLMLVCQLRLTAQTIPVSGRVVGPDNAALSGVNVTVVNGSYCKD